MKSAVICGLIVPAVSDQLDVLKLVPRRLDAAGLMYLITGSIAAPEDLVLSKLAWAKDSRSELQFRDVRSIIALQPGLDWPYVERWALRLTVTQMLKELRA